jgi:hypothetical protein
MKAGCSEFFCNFATQHPSTASHQYFRHRNLLSLMNP